MRNGRAIGCRSCASSGGSAGEDGLGSREEWPAWLSLLRAVRGGGHVPFEPAVNDALMAGKSVIEYGEGSAARAIREVWTELRKVLKQRSDVRVVMNTE